MKKRFILLLGIGFLALGIGITGLYLKFNSSRKITFEECVNAGGTAWQVALYHRAICSSCAEFQACEEDNKGFSDVRDVCVQVAACTECMERNFPCPDRCPDGRENWRDFRCSHLVSVLQVSSPQMRAIEFESFIVKQIPET
jgi:hypothetical protein